MPIFEADRWLPLLPVVTPGTRSPRIAGRVCSCRCPQGLYRALAETAAEEQFLIVATFSTVGRGDMKLSVPNIEDAAELRQNLLCWERFRP